MLHVQPKSGDDSFGDFWRKERKTHSNDLGLTSDSHIEGALYERPRYISCAKPTKRHKKQNISVIVVPLCAFSQFRYFVHCFQISYSLCTDIAKLSLIFIIFWKPVC